MIVRIAENNPIVGALLLHQTRSWAMLLGAGVALTIGAFATSARAENDPIALRDQHPLALLHLSALPQSAVTLPADSTKLFSSLTISNTLNRERGDFLIDAETRVLELGVTHSFADSLELSLTGNAVYRGGGESDQLIEEWHSIFGLPNGQRRRVPQSSFSLEGTNRDGSEFALTRDGIALGDLGVGAKQQLWSDKNGAVAVSLRGALPTGAESYGQDALDIATDLLATYSLGDSITVHGGIGYLFFGDTEEEGLNYRTHHGSLFFAAGWRMTAELSLLLQGVVASALLEDLPRYPDFSSYLDVALRYGRKGSAYASLLLRENPYPDKSTTDVSLLAELSIPLFSR